MKKIVLNGPAVDNGGAYRDAGAKLTVGDGADQIKAKRAAELVERGLADAEGDKAKG